MPALGMKYPVLNGLNVCVCVRVYVCITSFIIPL